MKTLINKAYEGIGHILPDTNTDCRDRLGDIRAESLVKSCNTIKVRMEIIKRNITFIKYFGLFIRNIKLSERYKRNLEILNKSKSEIEISLKSLAKYGFIDVKNDAYELKTELDILFTDLSNSEKKLNNKTKKSGLVESFKDTIRLRAFLSALKQK
ncbi:MAG: hypothetical protein JW985_01185 [Alphaproteobacteria bacterium]|nr:hypothetical protein [Alphaproteobacteria bacterium]